MKVFSIPLVLFILNSLLSLTDSHWLRRYYSFQPQYYRQFYRRPYFYGHVPLFYYCPPGSNNQQPTRNTVEILQDRRFSNLTSLIDQAGLKNSLSGEGPFTIFAPTNMAFERLSPDILEKITSDNDVLKRVLEYHVVSGQKLLLRDLRNGQELKTLQSNEPPLKIGLLNRRYPTVNTVRIVRGNLQGKNGVIHTIDRVLIPPSIANGKEKPEEP